MFPGGRAPPPTLCSPADPRMGRAFCQGAKSPTRQGWLSREDEDCLLSQGLGLELPLGETISPIFSGDPELSPGQDRLLKRKRLSAA